jgi:hypothetical protein
MNLFSNFLLILFLSGCNLNLQPKNNDEMPNSASGLPSTPLPRGRWGGQGMTLDVGSQFSIFELDCAHGTIDGDFVSDSSGVVSSTGLIVLENAGPGGAPMTFRARFLGTFDSTQLHLVIDYIDSSPNLVQQQFDLRHGEAGIVRKCRPEL